VRDFFLQIEDCPKKRTVVGDYPGLSKSIGTRKFMAIPEFIIRREQDVLFKAAENLSQ
jgi:hypothetical protein